MTSNVCRANFNGGRTAQGNNRYQWDYGQILEISGIDSLPDPFVAQFSNTPVLGTAKSTVGTGGRVEIPNEYFVSGQNIYCFIVLHTDEDDGRTVYIATIPVTKRPKPIDDPITPTQQSTIDTAIAALQAGVSRAEGFAQTATEQAGIATEAATTATEAAETATGAVADVEAAATRAETAADGAEASATAAEASATDAESAKTAALAAKDAAETAQASAEEAAANAEQSATTAEWYAERVERFLPTDTASGEIASFPDGADSVPMQSVVVTMEPVQDLHGYDYPWPAGGGKNKLDSQVETSGYIRGSDGAFVSGAEAWRCSTVYSAILPNTDYVLHKYATSSSSVAGYAIYDENKNYIDGHSYGSEVTVSITTPQNARYIRASWGVNSATPVVLMLATETDTTYAPYENLCPISGRTGADIEHTGANVWDEEWENGRIDPNSGKTIADAGYLRSKNFCSCKPNTSYYGKAVNNPSTFVLVFYDANKDYVGYLATASVRNVIFTTPQNAYYFKTYFTNGNYDISINYPETDHDYHAYQGETISVTFPSEAGTVYGGTLDVVSGELVVDRAMVDFGTLNWTSQSTLDQKSYYSNVINDVKKPSSATALSGAICSAYSEKIAANFIFRGNGVFCISQSARINVNDNAYSDAKTFKTAMNGVQLVYELATPQTYQLTPQQISLLTGQNNVWSEQGDTAVTYKADVQLYIDKRISALS